jgi:hypothetical protein
MKASKESRMPNVRIGFKLPEEQHELDLALAAGKMASALHEITNEVFRPARKHGYQDESLQAMLNAHPSGVEIVARLEDLFHTIIREHDLNDLI